MVGQIGLAGSAAYAATKAAMSALTHAWAAESSGVRVSAVAPGPVYRGIQPREATAAPGSTTLLNRAAEPEPVTHPPATKHRTR
jgi:NAD(P)-dependent dehydrogenase (short-subunit alcohol dehydrogenase family)